MNENWLIVGQSVNTPCQCSSLCKLLLLFFSCLISFIKKYWHRKKKTLVLWDIGCTTSDCSLFLIEAVRIHCQTCVMKSVLRCQSTIVISNCCIQMTAQSSDGKETAGLAPFVLQIHGAREWKQCSPGGSGASEDERAKVARKRPEESESGAAALLEWNLLQWSSVLLASLIPFTPKIQLALLWRKVALCPFAHSEQLVPSRHLTQRGRRGANIFPEKIIWKLQQIIIQHTRAKTGGSIWQTAGRSCICLAKHVKEGARVKEVMVPTGAPPGTLLEPALNVP